MARPNGHGRSSSSISATKFGVSIFVTTTVIILSQHLSYAQQCEVTCSQTAVIRDRPYSELVETAQTRGWEDEQDFGNGDNGDLFDIVDPIRYKKLLKSKSGENGDLLHDDDNNIRKRRSPLVFQTSATNLTFLENSSIDVNTAATTLLVSALMALGYYLVTEEPNIVGAAPVDFPNQPGTPLGGGIPLGRSVFVKEARGLFRSLDIGNGLYPVSVFPPFGDKDSYSSNHYRSTALIFEDKKCPNTNRKRRDLREFKKSVKEFKDNFVYGVNRIGSVFEQIDRYAQSRYNEWKRSSYEVCEPLYGLVVRVYIVEKEKCSFDPYAYNPCQKYEAFFPKTDYHAHKRQNEDSFSFNDPSCRTKC